MYLSKYAVIQILSINTEMKWLIKVLCKGRGRSEPVVTPLSPAACAYQDVTFAGEPVLSTRACQHACECDSKVADTLQVASLPCSNELSWNSMRAISARSSPEHETRWYATLNRIQGRRPVVSSGSDVSGCLLTILHHLQSSCRTAPDMSLFWRFCSREVYIVSTGNKTRLYHSSWFFFSGQSRRPDNFNVAA